ncbi:MFS transporter [Oceanobacillus sp. 1P07AA]|uniref:MFS transporter n=1 Tax=Oceanobacillus sp. 1P07AA TaxID=3132293 RepID=UPI0039A5F516
MMIPKILYEESTYKMIFWSSILNGIGGRFAQVGSLALLYKLTESGMALGILLSLQVLPTIVFTPISGYLADRFHKGNLLFWADLLRVPFALLPILAVSTEQLWLLYFSALAISIGNAIYRPVRFAIIPEIVQKKNLVSVNGLEQNVIGITLVFGSLLGGIIGYFFDVIILFFFHSLFLLCAACLVWSVKKINLSKNIKDVESYTSFSSSKLILNVALLRVLLIVFAVMPLANGIDNVVFNLIALDVFSKGNIGVGLIYGALGIGFVLSSFIAKWIRGKYITIAVYMIFFEGMGHLFLSQSYLFYQAILLAILISFVGGISNICFDTVLMKILPESKRGFLFGTFTMIQNSSMGIAMILAGFLMEWLSPLFSAFLVGISYVIFALIFMIAFKQVNVRKSLMKLKT